MSSVKLHVFNVRTVLHIQKKGGSRCCIFLLLLFVVLCLFLCMCMCLPCGDSKCLCVCCVFVEFLYFYVCLSRFFFVCLFPYVILFEFPSYCPSLKFVSFLLFCFPVSASVYFLVSVVSFSSIKLMLLSLCFSVFVILNVFFSFVQVLYRSLNMFCVNSQIVSAVLVVVV